MWVHTLCEYVEFVNAVTCCGMTFMKLFSRGARRARHPREKRRRSYLDFDRFESAWMLTAFVVNSNADPGRAWAITDRSGT